MEDINFSANEFSVIRKGGNQDILVFGDEARSALLNYMLEREQVDACPGHEDALFLSLQKKRITVRAVENLVHKYAVIVTPQRKYPSQAQEHLRHKPLPRNQGYISCGRRIRP